jgi:D-alanyl-D-alanine carboxypeptidase
LKKNIFTPLQMENVYDADASKLPATDPTGYERHALGPQRPSPQEGANWMFAAGELAMPPHDLALWDISIINRSLLSAASYQQMFKPVLLKDGSNTSYGLGVVIKQRDGRNIIEHSGEVSGFVSENLIYPDDRAAIIVLTNEMASGAASLIARQITPIVLGIGGPEPSKEEARALEIFSGLADGKIDRTQFTDYCNAYFSRQTLDDFAESLKPLGPPLTFEKTSEQGRGGMIFRSFEATFPDRKLRITTYEMPDGKLEQYLVEPE